MGLEAKLKSDGFLTTRLDAHCLGEKKLFMANAHGNQLLRNRNDVGSRSKI